MRIRTLLALSTGAALGAGWMYLLDPDHGESRRREARRGAARQVREGAVRAAIDTKRRAEEVAVAAVAGYQQARADGSPDPDGSDASPLGLGATAGSESAGSASEPVSGTA